MLSLESLYPSLRLFPSSLPPHFPKKEAEEDEEDERCEDRPTHLESSLFPLEKSERDDASPLTVFLNTCSPTAKGSRREAVNEDENAFVGARKTFPMRSYARQRGKARWSLCPLCLEKTSTTPRRIFVLLKRRRREVFEHK